MILKIPNETLLRITLYLLLLFLLLNCRTSACQKAVKNDREIFREKIKEIDIVITNLFVWLCPFAYFPLVLFFHLTSQTSFQQKDEKNNMLNFYKRN